jgi:hypothetical protein
MPSLVPKVPTVCERAELVLMWFQCGPCLIRDSQALRRSSGFPGSFKAFEGLMDESGDMEVGRRNPRLREQHGGKAQK